MQYEQTGTMEQRWQFHTTVSKPQSTHRSAVAIDCEMGIAFDNDSELIRLTLVDYFSGEPLIDSLVYPDVEMKHFNTRWSGITRAQIEKSRQRGLCILGRDAARRAVMQFVGPSTIVVGHGSQNDLSSLRWIHHRVVDSHIIELARRKEEENLKVTQESDNIGANGELSQKGGQGSGQRDGQTRPAGSSLKALAMKYLGRAIQVGNNGHDSFEDALAARDLIHTHINAFSKAAMPM